MSVNRHQPHVFILPEDDANRQIAIGFEVGVDTSQIRVLTEARGWSDVCNIFVQNHIYGMRKYTQRFVILLIDFDGDPNRLQKVQSVIPDDLKRRVFVLGVWSEPQALKRADLGNYEEIGRKIAEDCRERTQTLWTHELLKHNEVELRRLSGAISEWLF